MKPDYRFQVSLVEENSHRFVFGWDFVGDNLNEMERQFKETIPTILEDISEFRKATKDKNFLKLQEPKHIEKAVNEFL